MVPYTRFHLALWLCGGALLLLAACQSVAPTPPTATSAVQASATQPAAVLAASATSAKAPNTPSAASAATLTPQPTAIAAPTDTPSSPSATGTPTAANSPTAAGSPTTAPSQTARPARPPVTITPLGPPETASIYSTIGGPAGYSSSIKCQRASVSCRPVMSPGDISFSLVLAGDAAAPWTHFVSYGLSVEKDGANAAGMFMFVDAGWLQPGTVVGFGASRNFNQPGAYVIRSSGCMTTDTKSNNCVWTTIAGDVVSFMIQQ